MFYDLFEKLCDEKNVTPAQVRKDLEISQSTMASWKSKKLLPNAVTLIALADYFNTTPAYLAGNDLAKDPPAVQQRKKIEQRTQQHLNVAEEGDAFRKIYDEALNDLGKHKVHEYTEDLISNEKYLKRGYKPPESSDDE